MSVVIKEALQSPRMIQIQHFQLAHEQYNTLKYIPQFLNETNALPFVLSACALCLTFQKTNETSTWLVRCLSLLIAMLSTKVVRGLQVNFLTINTLQRCYQQQRNNNSSNNTATTETRATHSTTTCWTHLFSFSGAYMRLISCCQYFLAALKISRNSRAFAACNCCCCCSAGCHNWCTHLNLARRNIENSF